MATKVIHIREKHSRLKYDDSGNPNCNGYRILVHRSRGDKVRWQSTVPFTVDFKDNKSPFENEKKHFSDKDPSGTIDDNAAFGIYRYKVEAFNIVDDPEVDVED